MTTRVLQVLLSPRIGGAERLVAALERDWEDSTSVVAKTVYIDSHDAPRSRVRRLNNLRNAMRAFEPHVILAHSALPSIYARMIPQSAAPVISVIHSATDDHEHRVLRLAERLLRFRTSAVVTVSQAQAERYRRHFGSRIPVWVIPNGIAGDLPVKTEYRKIAVRITEIARVVEQKEPRTWILAARSTVANHPDVEFRWWGPIDAQVEEEWGLPLSGQVVFCGETKEPGAILLASDVFFHTATREAHSIGLLEAAAVGVPIVCSEGVSATLPEGLPAALFRDSDSVSAAAALTAVMANYRHAAPHAQAWVTSIRSEFGIEACRRSYDDLIQEVTRKQR